MTPRPSHQIDHRAQPLRVRSVPVSDHMNLKELPGASVFYVSTLRPDLLSHFPCVDLALLFQAKQKGKERGTGYSEREKQNRGKGRAGHGRAEVSSNLDNMKGKVEMG